MISDPLFYAAAIPAVILVGLAKGGFSGLGVMSMPLVALAVPPLEAAAIMLPILVVQDVVSVYAYWGKWDWRNLSIMLPGAVFGVLLAYLLASEVSEAAFELALGVISILFGLRYLLSTTDLKPKQVNAVAGGWWGMVSGFTSTVAHAGGPPFQVYMVPQRLPRDVFVATGVLFFALVNAMKVAPFTALGAFTRGSLTTSALLLPLAIVSTWAGVLLVQKFSGERFYRIVYILLVLVGLKFVWSGAAELL